MSGYAYHPACVEAARHGDGYPCRSCWDQATTEAGTLHGPDITARIAAAAPRHPAVTIAVARQPNRNAAPGRRAPAPWCYSWQTPEDITWTDTSRTTRPGPRAGGWLVYGNSLADLRAMLRRKFGPGLVVDETWKQAAR